MLSEPMTLYKLMNLYMLKQVNFPLTNAQLSNFFLEREYTTYFTLQQALNELLEAGLIKMETLHNSTRYEITKEGEETLDFFGKKINKTLLPIEDKSTSSTVKSGKGKTCWLIWMSPFPTRNRQRSCATTGRSAVRRFMPIS